MKLKVIHSIVQCGYVVGYDDTNMADVGYIGFITKSYARNTRKEAQDLCDKWEKDIENGSVPNYEKL